MFKPNMTVEEYVIAVLKSVSGQGFVACDIIQAERTALRPVFYNAAISRLGDFIMGDWKPGKFVRS